jgi:hypothetical protein
MTKTPALPERCSLRRAKHLTGLGEKKLAPLMTSDRWGQSIRVSDIEHLLGRRFTEHEWVEAGNAANRAAMERPYTEASEAV